MSDSTSHMPGVTVHATTPSFENILCVVQVASCMWSEDNFWKWVLAFRLSEAGTLSL